MINKRNELFLVSLTQPGPENFHGGAPKLRPAERRSHPCKLRGEREATQGRKKKRGQLPSEVNPVTHSGMRVSADKYETGATKPTIWQERQENIV